MKGVSSNLFQIKKFPIRGMIRYEPDFPTTVVTWELEKIENNKTSLKLLQIGFKADEKVKQYDEGWSHFLNELVKYCEKAK